MARSRTSRPVGLRWMVPSRFMTMAACFAAALCLMTNVAPAPPQPDPVPQRWEFAFEPGDLRLAVIETAGQPMAYYYMTYRVTNFSGQDRIFAPAFDLLLDSGELLRSGRDVPQNVVREIMGRLGNTPLLEDQLSIVDTLLQGRENARFGLVVWPVVDNDADEVTVFAAGFSGESQVYFAMNPETGQRDRFVLRKTRMLRYRTPGLQTGERGSAPYDLADAQWVMR